MRRFSTLAFLLIATISTLLAATYIRQPALRKNYINIKTGERVAALSKESAPLKTIKEIEGGVRVTYEFTLVRDDTVHALPGTHIFLFDEFWPATQLGAPAVPFCNDQFYVPTLNSAFVTIDTLEYIEYSFEMSPAKEDLYFQRDPRTPRQPEISVEGFFPEDPVTILERSRYNNGEDLLLLIEPLSYNHQTKTVRMPTRLIYTLHYNHTQNEQQIKLKSKNSNQEISSQGKKIEKSPIIPGDYLIITSPTCHSALSEFIEWKRAFGFNVHVESSDNWTVNKIKRIVAQYFQKYENMQYLLLVGDQKDVPSQQSELGYTHVSDLYYGFDYVHNDTLTNEKYWLNPDITVGRIPAQNLYQAKVALDKIIAYERCHNYTEGMFSRSLHCAQFEDEDKYEEKKDPEGIDGRESIRSFVRTSEYIIDGTRSAGIIPQRVYNCWTRQRILPELYFDDNPISEEIRAKTFNWNGQASDIDAALTNGVGYVLDRGHGETDNWHLPFYETKHIKNERRALWEPEADGIFNMLADTVTQMVHPVVFSITCFTGAFDKQPDCFAATSLCHKEGGCSAIIAATERSYSIPNNYFTFGVFDSMFPNKIEGINLSDPIKLELPIYTLGEILNRGLSLMAATYGGDNLNKIRLCRYQREIYHCFGDPSMKIRTNEQTKFENADIDMDYKTLTCRVKTGEGPAFISFYDANNGKIECVYSEEAEFTFSNVHSLGGVVTPGKQPPLIYKENVVISGPNKIPTIRSSWERTGAIPDPVFPEIDPKFENVKLDGETLSVTHNCGDNDRVIIYIADVKTASEVMKVECDSGAQSIDIDFSGVPSGIYAIMLIVNDNVADTVKISK